MELFHILNHPECTAVRKKIVDLGLQDHIRFRNVEISEEALTSLGRIVQDKKVPTLASEGVVLTGLVPIQAFLEKMAQDPAFLYYRRFDDLAYKVFDEVLGLLPSELREKAEQVHLRLMDEPSEELLDGLEDEGEDLDPSDICGLHVGLPFQQVELSEEGVEIPQVYLFRFAILDLLDPKEKKPESVLKQEIAVTILHELGHYFGLSEEDLERLGYD